MNDLDLLVLADRDSPYSRAYLTYLRHNGYRPRKILLLDFVGRSRARRAITRYLPAPLARLALDAHRSLRSLERRGWSAFLDSIQDRQPHRVQLTGRFPWTDHGQVEALAVDGFSDPRLHDRVRSSDARALLYSGGGLVTPSFLALPDVRVIHIHPGIVPHVRGADGLFWSILTRGRPGYSGFYMNPGVDTGDVVIREEFPLPRVPREGRGSEEIYRGLLHGYDTHMRARTLIRLVQLAEERRVGLHELPAAPQDEGEGRTYFFMHPDLREVVLRHIEH